MKKPISFKQFLSLPKEIQEQLSTFENEYLKEELKPSVKKRKMVELEKLLKKHDFLYQYMDGDYREWRRQNDMAQDIRQLKDLIGDDARALYKIYGSSLNSKLVGILQVLTGGVLVGCCVFGFFSWLYW